MFHSVGSQQVVLIEESQDWASYIQQQLTDAGYTVITFVTKPTINQVVEQRADVILISGPFNDNFLLYVQELVSHHQKVIVLYSSRPPVSVIRHIIDVGAIQWNYKEQAVEAVATALKDN